MKETIYNLVSNSLGYEFSPYFVKALIKEMPKDEIVELAKKELDAIEYFVRIELPEWNYWKEKKKKLELLIRYYSE